MKHSLKKTIYLVENQTMPWWILGLSRYLRI